MGVIKHFSSSSYDDPDKRIGPMSSWGEDNNLAIGANASNEITYLPNPNPENFTIQRQLFLKGLTIVKVQYHDCVNYEGNKIMVYECHPEDLLSQGHLDPHFSENTEFFSPIARFEPTSRGWEMAIRFVENWNE